ncbi:MAG: hypothetical protein CMC14_05135 [Flavobacteriaceae bacterium]|nr:hypothetical protein [Flavobacteriaceae bacterium]
MSVFKKHSAGLRNVGSYQVSGTPYVSSSTVANGAELRLDFPNVTNNLTVKMDNGKIVKKGVKISGDCGLQMNSNTEEFDDGGSPAESGAQTYVLWARADSSLASNSSFRYLFQHIGSSTRAVAIRYRYNNDKVRLQTFRNDGTADFKDVTSGIKGASSEYPLQHLVFATSGQSGDELKFYLNSVEVGSLTINGNLSEWNKIQYGATSNNGNFTYVESAVFNTEFTQAQVNEAYNSGKYFDLRNHSKAANLKIYHTFGDDLSDVVTDSTATINDIVGTNSVAGNAVGVGAGEGFSLVDETFNSGPNLRIHFNSPSTDSFVTSRKHFWNLDTQDDSLSLNVKTKNIYLSSDGATSEFTVTADLTTIPTGSMYKLTGSGIDE